MKSIIVDSRIRDAELGALMLLGFFPITLPRSRFLGEAVASHPDTLIFKYGRELITSADYCDEAAYVFSDIRERHEDIKITFTSDTLGECYPNDTFFNALICGRELFCKSESISRSILALAEREGLRVNPVNQGYPACSVLSLGGSAITSDKGMARAMEKRGIEVTLIREGYITLPPHQYGFIGGASVVLQSKVCFFGDYTKHPDADIIERAIHNAGYTPHSLSTLPLADLGSAIPLE